LVPEIGQGRSEIRTRLDGHRDTAPPAWNAGLRLDELRPRLGELRPRLGECVHQLGKWAPRLGGECLPARFAWPPARGVAFTSSGNLPPRSGKAVHHPLGGCSRAGARCSRTGARCSRAGVRYSRAGGPCGTRGGHVWTKGGPTLAKWRQELRRGGAGRESAWLQSRARRR